MQQASKISVIITTYNRPDALAAVLEACFCQDDNQFEIIIADDGSPHNPRQCVENLKRRSPVPLLHLLREDSVETAIALHPDPDDGSDDLERAAGVVRVPGTALNRVCPASSPAALAGYSSRHRMARRIAACDNNDPPAAAPPRVLRTRGGAALVGGLRQAD
eukprot:gene61358-83923_t